MEFIFDLETCGLPKFVKGGKRKYPSPDELDAYAPARVVSCCWMIIDRETKDIVQQEYYIVSPDGFEIPKEASAIHGISTDFAIKVGVPFSFVVERLKVALGRVDRIIAYNIAFDYHVLKSELIRYKFADVVSMLDSKQQRCAMIMAQGVVKGQFYPKLGDTFRFLFNQNIQDAHNAMGDVMSCYKCYKELCVRQTNTSS
jgi:DNA polymerase III epsilon subunit-like protein